MRRGARAQRLVLSTLGRATLGWAMSCCSPALAQPSLADWGMLGRTADRQSQAPLRPSDVHSVRWTLSTFEGSAIEFVGQSGVVVARGLVFALGRVGGVWSMVAADAEAGSVAWTAPVQAPVFDSWSTPCYDAANDVVVVASGREVRALRRVDGTTAWTRTLAGSVVNASPAITSDRPGRARVFITDFPRYDEVLQWTHPSRLWCINADPFHAERNPYQPGDVVWTAELGSASGNSPAYAAGRAYCAVSFGYNFGTGEIHCYDADQPSGGASPRWVYVDPLGESYFGGVSVRQLPGRVELFAGSYNFFGGVLNSALVKLDGEDGSERWRAPAGRSSSTPLPLPDGTILLSAGLPGYGSVPSLERFADAGTSGSLLWDTALDTWHDGNSNGVLDAGEYLSVGGWTQIPAVAPGVGGGWVALVGSMPSDPDTFAAGNELYVLDLTHGPGQVGFVSAVVTGAGSTPALSGAGVYSLGSSGLRALGLAPPIFDVNGDGKRDLEDVRSWDRSEGARDVDRNGMVLASDRAILLREIRRSDRRELTSGRP